MKTIGLQKRDQLPFLGFEASIIRVGIMARDHGMYVDDA